MQLQQSLKRRSIFFLLVFLLLAAPFILAPDTDVCPTCLPIKGFYTALNAGDIATAMSYIAKDSTLLRANNATYWGEAKIETKLKEEISNYSYQVGNIVADGNYVHYTWKVTNGKEVWTGQDSALVENGQVLKSKIAVP